MTSTTKQCICDILSDLDGVNPHGLSSVNGVLGWVLWIFIIGWVLWRQARSMKKGNILIWIDLNFVHRSFNVV